MLPAWVVVAWGIKHLSADPMKARVLPGLLSCYRGRGRLILLLANRASEAHDRNMDTIFPYAFGGLTLAILVSLIVGYLVW